MWQPVTDNPVKTLYCTACLSRISLVIGIMSFLLGACGGATRRLPAQLYFRYGTSDVTQVWRLESDGLTRLQITEEEHGVEGFSVSAADGSLAILSNNRLFLLSRDGKDRQLVADGSQVDPGIPDYYARGFVGSPVFSPDGRTLAYGFDGLHLYDVATGRDEHVLTNLGNLPGEPSVFQLENYSPGAWSPDGSQLLISISYFEGSTLAVMKPGQAEPFQRLYSDGPTCCTYQWSPDSQSVLVANPSYGTQMPGLWRYDAGTGERSDLVAPLAGSVQYAGWPVQLPSGDLLYFFGDQFLPEQGVPLRMVRSGPDGKDRTQVRPEQFYISDALWAQDGSLVLMTRSAPEGGMQVVLARPDGSPLQVLIEGKIIQDLAWGP
jgi:WD40 repeat protein